MQVMAKGSRQRHFGVIYTSRKLHKCWPARTPRPHLVYRAVWAAHALRAELLPHAGRPCDALLQRRIPLLLLLLWGRGSRALLRWQLF